MTKYASVFYLSGHVHDYAPYYEFLQEFNLLADLKNVVSFANIVESVDFALIGHEHGEVQVVVGRELSEIENEELVLWANQTLEHVIADKFDEYSKQLAVEGGEDSWETIDRCLSNDYFEQVDEFSA